MSIPVHPQPHHVPTGVIRVPHAKQRKRVLADRITGAPEEAQRATLSEDVCSSLPAEDLIARGLQARTHAAIRNDFDFIGEIRLRFATREIGGQAVIGGIAKQESRLLIRSRSGVHSRRPTDDQRTKYNRQQSHGKHNASRVCKDRRQHPFPGRRM
jgi:hypothetical protein